MPLTLFFFFKIVLAIQMFMVPYKFQDCLFFCNKKKVIEILMKIVFALQIALGSFNILITVIFQSVSTENLSVHFCHLQFLSSMSLGRSLTSVVKFIPRYYCVSGSVFLIPLLVYRTETNFVYVFISCNLLNFPINRFSLLLADSLGFST